MSITVGDIYGAFPNFSSNDMIKLCNGNKNLNGRTVVSLSNIAAFGNKDLSVFAAKKEGKTFTNLLGKNERTQFNVAAGIQDKEQDNKSSNNNTAQAIPTDTSIFDIAAQKKKNIA